MNSRFIITFIFMNLTILKGCFSLDFNCENRPGWKNSVDSKFKTQCVNNKQLTNNCQGAHLAHVLSWNGICETVESLFDNGDFESIQGVVALLFEIDIDAVVWIENPGLPKKTLTHQKYMGTTLVAENASFEKQAAKIAEDWGNGKGKDAATVNKFRLLVNSAPANLRYGEPKLNSGIGKFVDPMGDLNQKITDKEKRWNEQIFEQLVCKTADPSKTTCTKCVCSNACQTSSASTDDINYYVCK